VSAPKELRAGNVGAVLAALREHGSVSRTDLARLTGLSRTTVVSILEQLDGAGLVAVRDRGGAPDGRLGRPAARVALHPSAGVALGVCFSREDLHAVVTDLSLRVLAERSARFEGRPPATALIDLAAEVADGALEAAGVTRRVLVGAALGLPSPIDPDTGEADPHVLRSWASPSLREMVSERLGTSVRIENDANLEALAEMALGAGRGLRHGLYVHVGWGIGGAVVLDGRLRRGRAGAAGEIAHIPVRPADGPLCTCGRRGCLKSIASGRALLDALAVAHGGELDLDGLVRLVARGDPGAERATSDAGDAIGAVLAGLCTAMNPEAVVIGGPLGVAGSPLVEAAGRRIAQDVHPTIGPVAVRPAALGDVGGALGAASLVVRSADLFGHRVPLG
jgi:predicted NBD/HSP70 family sugar kinase